MVEADSRIKIVVDEVKTSQLTSLIASAQAGYARTTLRMGDIPRGMKLLQSLKSISVFYECAVILEGLKQYSEAALIFEKANAFEKAAELHIRRIFLNCLLLTNRQSKTFRKLASC